jgi:putative component of toxin-antitoxin plasmid stabilization module
VYYSVIGRDSVLLLLAGRKKSQGRDIPQAIRYLIEFEEGR